MKGLYRVLAATMAAVLCLSSAAISSAGVILSAEAALDAGAPVHTTVVANAARGIANDRNLRQSFTVAAPGIVVDTIQIGFDTSDQNAGLQMRVYRVSDANSNPWSPIGSPKVDLLLAAYDGTATANEIPDVTAGGALQISLTDADQFAFAGGTYAIEFSTDDPNQTSNAGTWAHSNVDPTDFYPDGLMYTESGNLSQPYRDFNLSISGQPFPEPSSMLLLVSCGSLLAVRRRCR